MESLMETAQGAFGGETLGRMSAWLHESPASTKAALQDALPVSLVGVANQASSEEGSRALLGRFQRGDYPHVEADELSRAVSDPEASDRVVQSSQGLMEGMFGGKLGSVVDGMAEHSGVSRSTISKVLGLAAPLILGMIGKRTLAQNMNAGGLRNYLGEQRSIAAGQLPGSLTKLLVPAGAAAVALGHRRVPALATGRPAERRAFPWWLIGLLAVVAIGAFAWSRMHREPARQAAVTSQTSLPASALTAGGVSGLSSFLDGNAPVPQRFVLQDLRFNTDSADIDTGSARVLDEVAAVLVSHEGARVRVEGHTDATGAPATNRQLSQARAEATKQYLAARGVDGSRIETAGYGSERPLATNDTAAGRAENRRTELVVVAR